MDEGGYKNVAERVRDYSVQKRSVQDHHGPGNTGHAHGHEREQFAPGHAFEIRLDHERRLYHAEKNSCRSAETERAAAESEPRGRDRAGAADFIATRLAGLKFFFTALDTAIGSFTQGKPVDAETLQNVVPFLATKARPRR